MEVGGAERVLSILANHCAEKGWDVTILTFNNEPSFFDLHPSITYSALNIQERARFAIGRFLANFTRLWVLRKAILASQPQAVVSFLEQVNVHTLVATIGTGIPIIVSERVDPSWHSGATIWNRLRRMTYPLASRVVSVTQGIDRFFEWLPREKRSVIHNPVLPVQEELEANPPVSGMDAEKKWVVAMGRLNQQKGFDLLLSAYEKVAGKYPDWQLIILGEGGLREELEQLREKTGLGNKVVFPGSIKNPYSILVKSELFVLSSRYEGFVNALGEAMACGLPVLSFDCPGGPREIVRHGIDGLLIPAEDVTSLAEGLDRLMGDEKERNQLAAKAPEVVERFSKDKIMSLWEEVISAEIKGA